MYDYQNGHLNLINSDNFLKLFELLDTEYTYSGVEERHPFFDIDFINLSLAIPANEKFKNGITRYAFREAMRNIIPDEVHKRVDKSDLSPYFLSSAKSNINGLIENLLSTGTLVNDVINKVKLSSIMSSKKTLSGDELSNLVYLNVIDYWVKAHK